jgi:hypothetical protein
MKKALLVTLALLITSRAWAQEASDVPVVREHDIALDAGEQRELRQWTDDVARYHRWYEQNRNRIAHDIFGFTSGRRELPPVPAWLAGKCDLLGYFDPRPVGELPAGCDLLSYYRNDFTEDPAAVQAALTQKQNEQDPHASFWKHVHLDAGWTSLDYRMHTYGLVGVHVTLPELAKRVQIFLPPGFLLLAVPDGRGGTSLQPAATIGVSVKMFAFEFPQGKNGTAYFNLAKAYLIDGASGIGGSAAVDLLGLSFAWSR